MLYHITQLLRQHFLDFFFSTVLTSASAMFHVKQLGCPNMTTLRGRRPPSVTERLFA